MDARLVHKDPKFEQLNGIMQSETLPYKSNKKLKQ